MSQPHDFPFDITDVAELLHLRIRRPSPQGLYVDCPICNDKRGKMHINTQTDTWRCNYCDESGGMLALYAKVHKLHMSIRTIQDLEHGISNPKAETILLIARELDISIDAILFPNIVRGHISKTAMDFFAGKSEAEVQKYVSLCQQADKLKTDK